MAKIIGYARVSSREQALNSHALEQQIQRLKDTGVENVYFDIDSGRRDNRKSFRIVMDMVRSRQISGVVITRLDRLTRSLITLRRALEEFQDNNVNLKALDDSIDLSTAAGKFHLNILGALAEMEVDRLSERVSHGWAHLRNRKIAVNPPFGYIEEDGRHYLDHKAFLCLLENREERSRAQIAREIVETFLERKTLRMTLRAINEKYGIHNFAHNNGKQRRGGKITKELFRFSPAGLQNWLTNPVLQGHICYLRKKRGKRLPPEEWQIHYDTHPDQRIMTKEEGETIEKTIKDNYRFKGFGSTALKYPLSGLIFCGECRSSCYSVTGAKSYHRAKRLGIKSELNYYFQCKNWRMRACCQKKLIRMEKVEAAVIETLNQKARDLNTIAEASREEIDPPEIQALKIELMYYENAPGNLAGPIISALKQKIFAYYQELQLSSLITESQRQLLTNVFTDPLYWETLEDKERRNIYRTLINRVVIEEGEVIKIELAF